MPNFYDSLFLRTRRIIKRRDNERSCFSFLFCIKFSLFVETGESRLKLFWSLIYKPTDYDSDDNSGITDLSTNVLLEWLHDIEPSENSFKGSVTVFLFWRDERLANLTTKATDLSAARVWQPSVRLYNLDGNTFELAPKSVRLLPSGEIRATQAFTIESYCIIVSTFYPMDQNSCKIFLSFMGNR